MATSATFTDASPVTSSSSGGYCVRSDIENIFGIPNIIKWAILSGKDPESNAGLAEINSRINWAINWATVDFENSMRQGRYTLPITGAGASIWATEVVATLAGLRLYGHLRPTQRGPDGNAIPHPYADQLTYVTLQLDYARSGKIRLDAVVFGKGQNAPEVTHQPSHAAYGPGQHGSGQHGSGQHGYGHSLPTGPFVG